MRHEERDEDYGLTPREWLDSDPVPLTSDVDLNDPEQRLAWIRANNEENFQRSLELQARRARRTGGRAPASAGAFASGGASSSGGAASSDGSSPGASSSGADRRSTTVVAVRIQNPEHRALVRLARREGVTVSDLMRRWARAGLDAANGTTPIDNDSAYPEPAATDDDRARERDALRQAAADAADAAVQRITDDLRRLREIAVTTG